MWIQRLGDLINRDRSDDGTADERGGKAIKLVTLSPDVFVGFAVMSHHEGTTAQVGFDQITLG